MAWTAVRGEIGGQLERRWFPDAAASAQFDDAPQSSPDAWGVTSTSWPTELCTPWACSCTAMPTQSPPMTWLRHWAFLGATHRVTPPRHCAA